MVGPYCDPRKWIALDYPDSGQVGAQNPCMDTQEGGDSVAAADGMTGDFADTVAEAEIDSVADFEAEIADFGADIADFVVDTADFGADIADFGADSGSFACMNH